MKNASTINILTDIQNISILTVNYTKSEVLLFLNINPILITQISDHLQIQATNNLGNT